MPARFNRRSSSRKPQGSMMSTADAQTGGEAQERAGVLRDIGLVEGEAHRRDFLPELCRGMRCFRLCKPAPVRLYRRPRAAIGVERTVLRQDVA